MNVLVCAIEQFFVKYFFIITDVRTFADFFKIKKYFVYINCFKIFTKINEKQQNIYLWMIVF